MALVGLGEREALRESETTRLHVGVRLRVSDGEGVRVADGVGVAVSVA